MIRLHTLHLGALLLLLLLPTAAQAQDPANCGQGGDNDPNCPDDDPRMDDARYLRSLSLDLRGDLPTVAELQAVADDPAMLETYIDTWLASEAFVTRAVRLHGSLLWPNISNVQLMNAATVFFRSDGSPSYWIRARANTYRGGQQPCFDTPVVKIDGVIQTTYDPGTNTHREGYELIYPYSDPGTPIKVCAFDAQTDLISPTGTEGETRDGFGDPARGCGPNLNWCRVGGAATNPEVLNGFGQDVERRVARVIRDDLSYLELFTSPVAFVNGPIVHYWNHQSEMHAGVRLKPIPVPVEQLPDLDYTDTESWHTIQLGDEHAGILTSPLYLLRFQTGRARANRFSNAFMCMPHSPPANGIFGNSKGDDDDVPTGNGWCSSYDGTEEALIQDLQCRPGCDYCHALLEPEAAYWGRWTDAGAGYLSPDRFPAQSDECYECATTGTLCSADCSRYYVTNPLSEESEDFIGMLKTFEFRKEVHQDNPELGPKRMVTSAVADASGRLPTCVSGTAASYLLGRDVKEEKHEWISELSAGFVASGFSYRSLIREIVTSPVYRSLR